MSNKKTVMNRKVAYGILFFCSLALTVLLLWFAWRAMTAANPWFSGIGIASAVLYMAIILTGKNSQRSIRSPSPGKNTRPKLYIVKK